MSFALPPVKSKPSMPGKFGIAEGALGVPDLMTNGLTSARVTVETLHPLASAELNYHNNKHQMNMTMLRNIQGLHAPLRIGMEVNAARKVGRMPFMQSSNVMLNVITGKDILLGPEDIFNTSEFLEVSGQPHAIVERSLDIL